MRADRIRLVSLPLTFSHVELMERGGSGAKAEEAEDERREGEKAREEKKPGIVGVRK